MTRVDSNHDVFTSARSRLSILVEVQRIPYFTASRTPCRFGRIADRELELATQCILKLDQA